ncbi:MAG TPA: hypothetical protein VFP97_04355, partial [Chitinophagaceae bacterium]|nr:hypothetical protein [Chitinophagaceae bacterium]
KQMSKAGKLVSQLFSIRNRYGKKFSSQKLHLLKAISNEKLASKKDVQALHSLLLFLIAYPDNQAVYTQSSIVLQQLHLFIQSHKKLRDRLYNSGITNTQLCAAYSFEMVKWMRTNYKKNIRIRSFEAGEAQIQAILSVVMPKVESEIMQDGNAEWRSWLKQSMKKDEDLLDRLIAVFDETDIRPEVKNELWSAIGINIEIDFATPDSLPDSLFMPYYHRSLVKKKKSPPIKGIHPPKVLLDKVGSEKIIECSRMILVRHLREIDPITFTSADLISYYRLPRGLSIALMGMVPARRHPIDSYMGYAVFKNGLPVAYAGSWVLFDSARIGLNIFPAYRGGESQYIFEQVLKIHQGVYRLKRFSTDPYQIGKDNSDGIHSGAFWIYYRAGFRPICDEQKDIAEAEAKKIRSAKGYLTPATVLKELAESRLELNVDKKAVQFDVTDLSRAYAAILKNRYTNKRKPAEELATKKLAAILQIKNWPDVNLQYVLKNWSILVLTAENELRNNTELKKILKKLFELKASGSEEEYIYGLQRSVALKKMMEKVLDNSG